LAEPLRGVKVVEIAGIGPAPFAAMLLADMGAEVLCVERFRRVSAEDPAQQTAELPEFAAGLCARGKRRVAIDLKHPRAAELLLRLLAGADVLIEGFRPGVMERLGLGPEVCLARNPKLLYGRMTGYGREGPLARAAGHDINYIALSGVLHAIGRRGEAPVPPLNLVGDFGGGGMLLAFGIACGLFERECSGKGQVIDAAMLDGAALLMSMVYGLRKAGVWRDERGSNWFDGGAPFYDVYATCDGQYIAIGALEPAFFNELLCRLAQDPQRFPPQYDRERWPEMRARFSEIFANKTRAEWCEIFKGSDACFAPVLSLSEAPSHPHNRAHGTFVERDGGIEPAPAPRFSRTRVRAAASEPAPMSADEIFADWGLPRIEIAALRAARVID